MFEGVYFENPDLLHLLWVLLFQGILMWVYWHWRRSTLRRLGSPVLEQRLLQGFSIRRFRIKNILFSASLILVVLAIANPVKIVKIGGKLQLSSDVILVLDISNSMLAKDVLPSRLEKAKNFIQKLVPALEGERFGLVFFAGEAYPQMPLSTDAEALLMFVRNAHPDFITDQGTDIGTAIELAGRMLENEKETGQAIVLISDGENHEEKALQAVQAIRDAGVLLYTVSVGTTKGVMIPRQRGGNQRDFTGQTVRTSANEVLLRSLAEEAGGEALSMQEETRAVETIKTAVSRLQKSAAESNTTTGKVFYFPWLLLLAVVFLALEQVLWWRKKD